MRTNVVTIFFTTALIFACVGCASLQVPQPNSASPRTTDVEISRGWQKLHHGELASAAAAFSAWRQRQEPFRSEGLIGELTLGMILDDQVAIEASLAAVGLAVRRPEMLIVAAQAALGLRNPQPWMALIQRACDLSRTGGFQISAGQICSELALHKRTSRVSCKAGCADRDVVTLGLYRRLPLVMVSVSGAPPAPFILDTGASTTVLSSEFAARHKLPLFEDVGFVIEASGGRVESLYTSIDITLGGQAFEAVPAAVFDLPLPGVAGILSPQSALAGRCVTINLREMHLTLAPSGDCSTPPESLVVFPWLVRERNPYLLVSVADRPPRPMLLDTGASHTRLDERLDALGAPLERVREIESFSAGGLVKTWTTEALLKARVGTLTWEMSAPRIHRPVNRDVPRNLGRYGLLGMDLFRGRVIILDVDRRYLALSQKESLDVWPSGQVQTWRVGGALVNTPFEVREAVVSNRDGALLIDVEITRRGLERRFRVGLRDNWGERGAWLVTRKATALWDLTATEPRRRDVSEAPLFWFPAMVPFKASGPQQISVEILERKGVRLICSKIELAAEVGVESLSQARFVRWECPGVPWRTLKLQLLDRNSETVLWEMTPSL